MPPSYTRRTTFIGAMGALGLAGLSDRVVASPRRPIRALAFDGFTILDPRAIPAAVSAVFPEKGKAIAGAWTAKIFELSWIETAAGRYSGFRALADAALQQVGELNGITIGPADRASLISTFGRLPLWPDAEVTLQKLRQSGIRLAFLSNLEEGDLEANMRRNGLDRLMEPPLSTDKVGAFKPSSRAYAMARDHFGLAADGIGFAAFGGWDALGAKWFGYRTAWVNRLGSPAERLSPAPDVSGSDLSSVLRLAAAGGK